MCGTARHRKAFLRHTYQASSVQDHWKEHARLVSMDEKVHGSYALQHGDLLTLQRYCQGASELDKSVS